jgi:biotin carboxyl carrier protein
LKLLIEIDGQLKEMEFDSTGGAVRLSCEGRSYEAQVSEPEPGLFVVIMGGRVYRCALERRPSGEMEVTVNGARTPVAVSDPKRRRSSASSGSRGGGRAALSSPMPGKVVRLLCAVGDEVAANQGVLVVEAMKMQNEVQSPKAGRVIEIRVREGQTVNAGEVLAVVER